LFYLITIFHKLIFIRLGHRVSGFWHRLLLSYMFKIMNFWHCSILTLDVVKDLNCLRVWGPVFENHLSWPCCRAINTGVYLLADVQWVFLDYRLRPFLLQKHILLL
jgi:hypothetical protein